ncbi:MAG: hypothetical protein JOZ19_00875, partial [Rubrobacter sp.]|nr:hypothetical protein [Rubrobacter sp.]
MRWAASGAGSMGGIVYNAISGIETALWDVVGNTSVPRFTPSLAASTATRFVSTPTAMPVRHWSPWTPMPHRRPKWLPDDAETAVTSEANHPVHGRAYGEAETDEVFTPEMYAERAREVAD